MRVVPSPLFLNLDQLCSRLKEREQQCLSHVTGADNPCRNTIDAGIEKNRVPGARATGRRLAQLHAQCRASRRQAIRHDRNPNVPAAKRATIFHPNRAMP